VVESQKKEFEMSDAQPIENRAMKLDDVADELERHGETVIAARDFTSEQYTSKIGSIPLSILIARLELRGIRTSIENRMDSKQIKVVLVQTNPRYKERELQGKVIGKQ
jgi:hypothetical protein